MRLSGAVRNVALSALLGLPAALVAHAIAFGGAHEMGGAIHDTAIQGAALFALAAAVFIGIGAARRARWYPSPRMLLVTTTLWLVGIELTERAHAIPVAFCLLAIALTTALFASAVSAYARTVERIAEFICAREARPKPVHDCRLVPAAFHRRRTCGAFSLFSRPPPALS